MPNIVYVLSNEAMPGLVKIGLTDGSVEDRLSQLSAHSGVPLPFECHYAAEVDDMKRVERLLHQLFAEHRVNPKREFFRIDPEKVVIALSIGKFKDVTPDERNVDVDEEEKAALQKVKERRPRMNLAAIGIAPDAQLTFSRDETRIATVVADNKVNLDGEILSLSAAALKLLGEMSYTATSVSGSQYWMYEGEILDERRRRIEAEKFDDQ